MSRQRHRGAWARRQQAARRRVGAARGGGHRGLARWMHGAVLAGLLCASLPARPDGSPARPQMDAASAARHRVADYLAQGPSPWRPADVDTGALRPDFIVAADGSGTHRSVQQAVDAVPARMSEGRSPLPASVDQATSPPARRWVIRIRPGVYRGPLCIRDRAPIALLGEPGDASAVVLVDGRFNGLAKRPGVDEAQPCHPNLAAATHGTSGSASVVVASPDTLLADLTIANDATEGPQPPTEGAQAVALMTVADRVQLENLRLVSHQDTFYVRRPGHGAAARVFVRGSVIEGDVDVVFGNATLVIDDSTLVSRAGRRAASAGAYVLAPSTPADVALGFLVQRSRFVAEPGLGAGRVSLGRAWDEGVPPGQWQAGRSPNGQALVRDSAIGPHIAGPADAASGAGAADGGASRQPVWAASTARRPFRPADTASGPRDAAANRFFEFNNTTLPADIAREVLAPGDGWAAADGGTRGGADAAPADVHVVRNRAQLVAALRPHAPGPERPRIVKVQGRIDLSEDDAGRPQGGEAWRDPAFSWAAYAAAYDPATWGRRAPEGPLEEARRRSAAAQAAHVVLRVPSRTTLLGLGRDAQIVRGGLFIDQAQDVIVRNLRLSDAYDHFPAWDPKDGAQGEWNAEFDNLMLRRAERVWVDHCSFDDGGRPDAAEPVLLGRPMQRHDGLLDITRGSTHVTVSWNHFQRHDKTSLVGGSDRHLEDEGRLKVTYHHNLWDDTRERSPRVRFGQVHLYNNLHRVQDLAGFGYSIGVGHRSAIVSQNNAWLTPPGLAPHRLVRGLGGQVLADSGSQHNGLPIDLLQAWRAALAARPAPGPLPTADVGWVPPYVPAAGIDPAAEVPSRVRAGAGAGRLWTGPAP